MVMHADLETGGPPSSPVSLSIKLCIDSPKRGACAIRLLKLHDAYRE